MLSQDHLSTSHKVVRCVSSSLALLLVGLIPFTVAGCGPGNPLSALAALASFSGEQFDELSAELETFNEMVEALPSAAVRIVNNTDVIAEIELASAVEDLISDSPFLGIPPIEGGFSSFTSVDGKTVQVLPQGTASGTIKCGQVIGVAIRAPSAGVRIDLFNDSFGLFISPGNVQLSGVGVADDSFTGDILAVVRFVRPDEDGFDCQNGTLVIEIETAATVVEGADSSDSVQTTGSASLSIE